MPNDQRTMVLRVLNGGSGQGEPSTFDNDGVERVLAQRGLTLHRVTAGRLLSILQEDGHRIRAVVFVGGFDYIDWLITAIQHIRRDKRNDAITCVVITNSWGLTIVAQQAGAQVYRTAEQTMQTVFPPA